MADDDGIAVLGSRDYGQILENAVGLDAVGQLGQVAQVFPRVVGVGVELFDGDVDQASASGIIIVIVAQRSKEGLVHVFPILPLAGLLLVVDVVALAGVCRIVGALQLLADEVALLPLTFDL